MKNFLLAILSLLITEVTGQTNIGDTTIQLSQVQINASRLIDFSAGLKIILIDSTTLHERQFQNLDEILSGETPIYIKSYGQGGVATIAFRGTSATHTGVFWNGIQINPPNIRLFDLSLAPVAWFNSVQILSGGSASLFGSGNIGGAIHLNNDPVFNRGQNIQASIAAGSFCNYSAFTEFATSAKSLYSSTGILFRSSENDFPYQNLSGEKVHQQNAACQNIGVMQNLYWKLHKNWLAGASFWLQSNRREIPATMIAKPSEAKQKDQTLKSILSFKHYHLKGNSSIKIAFFLDDLHYQDSESQLEEDKNSKINTNKLLAEFQGQRQIFHNLVINSGVSFIYESAESNNYKGNIEQNQVGLFFSALQTFHSGNWKINLNLRQDLTENYIVPFMPAMGLEGKIWRSLYGKVNVSRNFRIPSFNELFWDPYGNPELEPEKSWNEEISLIVKTGEQGSRHFSEFVATIYNSNVNNWIIWLPEGNNWRPENVRTVWSRGMELSGYTTFKINRIMMKLNEGYTFARSTNETKIYSNDRSYQKQLIYVPEHRMFLNFSAGWKGFSFKYNYSITGIRYTTSDNLQFLPVYSLHNLTLAKTFKLKQMSARLQFDINNLFDENYQAINYYPMPGRSYNIKITLKHSTP